MYRVELSWEHKRNIIVNNVSPYIFMVPIERICIENPGNKSKYNHVKSNKKSRKAKVTATVKTKDQTTNYRIRVGKVL